MKVAALIVAAGRGVRAGGALPKQYRPLMGSPLLRHTVNALQASPHIAAIAVVIHADDQALYKAATKGLNLLPPITGGASRQESVRLGLESLSGQKFDYILVHDAARPFPSPALISRLLQGLAPDTGVIPAVAVADSLKRVKNGICQAAVDRTGLWRAQTPQAFPFAGLMAAHQKLKGCELGDDAAVAQDFGMEIKIIAGEEMNFKVTEAADFSRAEGQIMAALMDIRVGSGFDVHRFGPGHQVTLGGVAIPHAQGLIGHSDADVALHALTDAILGALGEGDIGRHFPPSDPRWKGVSSDRFLAHAAALLRTRSGVVAHADLTIICEAPKIGPHRDAMTRRIAEILEIDQSRVSVKATTTEGLGFTGRGEGIAAEAVATIRLPS